MIPAQQRLGTDGASVRQPDDRLVHEVQLITTQRRGEIPLVFVAPFGLASEVGVEALHLALALLLGTIDGQIGVAHEIGGAVPSTPRTAMPMQPLTETDWKSLTRTDCLRSAITWRASTVASAVRRVDQQIPNSSAPMRATSLAVCSKRIVRRSATERSKTSPAAWPRPSLMAVKSSRSMNTTVGS